MKIVRRTAGLAVLAFAAAAALPAQAAGPFVIQGAGPGSAASSGVTLLTGAKGPACSETVAHHPAQGIDSIILDGRGFAGRTARIDWGAQQNFGGIDVTFFDAACNKVFFPGVIQSSRQPGAWFFGVPPSTRFLVVSSSLSYNVTFHINPV